MFINDNNLNYMIYSIKMTLFSGMSLNTIKFKLFNFSFFMMIFTNFMILISNSWFIMWMIMEINMICFIKILSSNKKLLKQIMMNYFLIQSFNSYMFIFSFINLNFNFMIEINYIMIFMAMINKLGIPPFYMWYLMMNKNLNCWLMIFINSCIQKFIPLMIINNTILMYKLNNFLIYFLLFNLMYTPFLGLNSLNLKIMMSISSNIQIMWLILMIYFNEMLWMLYFILYIMNSMSIMMMLKLLNINYINDTYVMKLMNYKYLYLIFSINIITLAGLPTFLGFMNKFMFMWNLSKMNLLMNLMMLLSSLINTMFYIRIIYSFLNNFYNSLNLNFKFINFNEKFKLNFNIILLNILILSFMINELI